MISQIDKDIITNLLAHPDLRDRQGMDQRVYARISYKKNGVYGWNCNKTHPLQAKFAKYLRPEAIELHAEMDAIVRSVRIFGTDWLENTTLYVVRLKRPGPNIDEWVTGLAKPCEICMAAIEAFDINRVVYTIDKEGIRELIR